MDAIGAVEASEATSVAISAIIATAARRTRRLSKANRWREYELAKALVDRLNPTPDEYERAIRLLVQVLKI